MAKDVVGYILTSKKPIRIVLKRQGYLKGTDESYQSWRMIFDDKFYIDEVALEMFEGEEFEELSQKGKITEKKHGK